MNKFISSIKRNIQKLTQRKVASKIFRKERDENQKLKRRNFEFCHEKFSSYEKIVFLLAFLKGYH
jgi:hypothetical protein